MRRRIWKAALVAVAVAAGGVWSAARGAAAAESVRVASAEVAAEAVRRDRDILFYERRAGEDARSAADRASLAALYLQRSRASGDFTDVARAESLARESIALRAARNAHTNVTLAASLMAQHRFADARDVAAHLASAEPDVPSYRALLGEVELELGDYDAARRSFAAVRSERASLSVAPRLARWAELRGDTAAARRILYRAMAAADSAERLPREQVAWFHLRVGDFELRRGRTRAAEWALRGGLAVSPDDHRLLGAMARAALERRDYARAIDYGDRAIAAVLDPAALGVVSDAYAALGDGAKAAEYARALDVSAGQRPGEFHRAWALWLLDHDRRVPELLERARAELRVRRDVYGFDLLAWALHKSGRHEEARAAMARALALGTQDVSLFRHAAAVERALGREVAARAYEARAAAVGD